MNHDDLEQIHDAATRFRAAIENLNSLPLTMEAFPRGACGDASELLGQYLQDSGLGTWMYVMGFRSRDGWTHAWLEAGGVITDITADQFDDFTEAVIVTDDRTWHDTEFPRASSPRPANTSFFSGRTNSFVMTELYEELRAAADAAL